MGAEKQDISAGISVGSECKAEKRRTKAMQLPLGQSYIEMTALDANYKACPDEDIPWTHPWLKLSRPQQWEQERP